MISSRWRFEYECQRETRDEKFEPSAYKALLEESAVLDKADLTLPLYRALVLPARSVVVVAIYKMIASAHHPNKLPHRARREADHAVLPGVTIEIFLLSVSFALTACESWTAIS